jgi:transcriptional regulator with XRE-family HTH domain
VTTAQTIRTARARKGYTLRQLGELIDASHSAVYQWETAGRLPRQRYAERLEAALGLEPGSLEVARSRWAKPQNDESHPRKEQDGSRTQATTARSAKGTYDE